jgi:uncharacterized protein YbjQ (UPF0145 family)
MMISTMNDVPGYDVVEKNLVTSRQEVIDRMVAEAEARGGNAVLAMRFDTSEMGGNWTEICAYGTAVTISKR